MNQLFDVPNKKLMDGDTKYSRVIKIPQYEPSVIKPKLWELCDKSRYTELLRNITTADISDDVKNFLRLAATRHIIFNYSKIADYYASAEVNVQKLMEESALVIIDVDDAIANGYVKLSRRMKELIDEQKLCDRK